jgi:hypothetical protein
MIYTGGRTLIIKPGALFSWYMSWQNFSKATHLPMQYYFDILLKLNMGVLANMFSEKSTGYLIRSPHTLTNCTAVDFYMSLCEYQVLKDIMTEDNLL